MVRPRDRVDVLNQARRLKMARSPHAYVRGSTVKFYEWLTERGESIPRGPDVWICGDCHLGNLGPLADAQGRVEIQVRDLDQTVIGNPAHDIVRLALSLASAARSSDLPGVVTARMIEAVSAGYAAALSGAFDDEAERAARPENIQALIDQSIRRRWRHLALERLDTVEPKIPLGKKFWALEKGEKTALRALFGENDISAAIRLLQGLDGDAPLDIVDCAYWMKGCSSLGRLRYAVMLRAGAGKRHSICLMDVKEAPTAAAPRSPEASTPRDNAARVVAGARALSPNLGNRMMAAKLLGKSVALRELMPQDLKIEIDRLSETEAAELAGYLAGIVGRAHGRQMERSSRRAWARAFIGTSRLDAPGWLWSSVVELISIHEAAYLDHCRRFALAEAA